MVCDMSFTQRKRPHFILGLGTSILTPLRVTVEMGGSPSLSLSLVLHILQNPPVMSPTVLLGQLGVWQTP